MKMNCFVLKKLLKVKMSIICIGFTDPEKQI